MRLVIPASLFEGPFLLLCSWVSKPTSSLSQQVFWVDVFHSFIWWFIQSCFLCSLFCTLLLSWCLLLWKLSLKNQLFVNSSKLSTILQPRAKFAITNYDSLYVSLLYFLYSLQVKLYNSELSSIMICVFDECDASCPYSFIDSSLHKPKAMFIELSFAWG